MGILYGYGMGITPKQRINWLCVLGLVEMEIIFFIVAGMGLCFAFCADNSVDSTVMF